MRGVCTDSTPWLLVMEYMPEGSLVNLISKHRLLSSLALVKICSQIADACAYLHHRQYIHRDIAARNILCRNKDCVKLADFGMAKNISSALSYSIPPGVYRPVPIPSPPENGAPSFGTDVWYFGVFLWEVFLLKLLGFESHGSRK